MTTNMNTKFWLEYLMGRDNVGDVGISGRIILKWILQKKVMKVRNRFR
jgi:hypothetical protein